MGQPFLVITSGIGPMQAEACVQLAMTICPSELLFNGMSSSCRLHSESLLAFIICTYTYHCPGRVKETFYIGTSGWPAAVGGILNPPSCDSTNIKRGKGEVTRIGDLCIPAFAMNWSVGC